MPLSEETLKEAERIQMERAELESLKIRFEKLKEAYIKLQQSVISERVKTLAQIAGTVFPLYVPINVKDSDPILRQAVLISTEYAEKLLEEIERRCEGK